MISHLPSEKLKGKATSLCCGGNTSHTQCTATLSALLFVTAASDSECVYLCALLIFGAVNMTILYFYCIFLLICSFLIVVVNKCFVNTLVCDVHRTLC